VTIYGDVPSKKNSKRRIKRGNSVFMVPSLVHERWHAVAMQYVREMSYPTAPNPAAVKLTFYPSTRRSGDLSNKAESVMDLLVDCGILDDDNWFAVPQLTLHFGGVDREKPRVDIEFSEACQPAPSL
jgi:Holliday junction resolvase RusA-like endonuclease